MLNSSQELEFKNQLGQEEVNMSIFQDDYDHKDVIDATISKRTAYQGKAVTYQQYQTYHYYHNSSRHRPARYRYDNRHKKIMYREKDEEYKPQRQLVKNNFKDLYEDQMLIDFQAVENSQKNLKKEEEMPAKIQIPKEISPLVSEKANSPLQSHKQEQKVEISALPCQVEKINSPEPERQLQIREQRSELRAEASQSKQQEPNRAVFVAGEIAILQLSLSKEEEKVISKKKMNKKQKIVIAAVSGSEDNSLSSISIQKKIKKRRVAQKQYILKHVQQQEIANQPLQFYSNAQFVTVQVVIVFKGPILTLKIKSFVVGPYQNEQIKLAKDRNNIYYCSQRYEPYIKDIQNIAQSRRQFSSDQKQLKFQLCKIRLPLNSISQQNIYEKKRLSQSPIEISRISVVCFCSRKFQASISSLGVTCPNCSLLSELSVKVISLK